MSWKAVESREVNKIITEALEENINFRKTSVFGLPATFLDEMEFYDDAPFLEDAPFLRTLIANPNHIGCHTIGDSESYFKGSQKIEKELIGILAEGIFKAQPGEYDGYVSAGGTEANIQAFWVYRNYFNRQKGLKNKEIAILTSSDSHYSVDKASDLLNIEIQKVLVDEDNRQMDTEDFQLALKEFKSRGFKAVIVQFNMGTTMFGSVDSINDYIPLLMNSGLDFQIHVDAAFGGFIYPFSQPDQVINFLHPYVNSISLDAHKMLQAPYGTGIFLVKKGWISYTQTKSATYVKGYDYTLSGSRSGANAVAVWMILKRYGSEGWQEKIEKLIRWTNRLSEAFKELNIKFFKEEGMNIITFKNDVVPHKIRKKYNIVSDGVHSKIIVMTHVTEAKIDEFLKELKDECHTGII